MTFNLQKALQNLSEWCKLNGMLLNTDKTKAMLITTCQKRLHLHNDILHLTYNNDVLNSVENEKVFSVHIDNNLTWCTVFILILLLGKFLQI